MTGLEPVAEPPPGQPERRGGPGLPTMPLWLGNTVAACVLVITWTAVFVILDRFPESPPQRCSEWATAQTPKYPGLIVYATTCYVGEVPEAPAGTSLGTAKIDVSLTVNP